MDDRKKKVNEQHIEEIENIEERKFIMSISSVGETYIFPAKLFIDEA